MQSFLVDGQSEPFSRLPVACRLRRGFSIFDFPFAIQDLLTPRRKTLKPALFHVSAFQPFTQSTTTRQFVFTAISFGSRFRNSVCLTSKMIRCTSDSAASRFGAM